MTKESRVLAVLGILFTSTGFVGLIVEQVYEKLLGTLVGGSTHAAATVLAAYFIGLMLGGLAYERALRRRVKHPLRVYAYLEGAIAALLVVAALLFDRLIPLFRPLLSAAGDHMTTLQIARVLVSAIWILPPTFLMGASLPAIADSLRLMPIVDRHRALTAFYGLNLLGAILASIAAPYAVFPLFGLDGALTICAALGGAVCITGLRIARMHDAEAVEQSAEIEIAGEATERRDRAIILAVALCTGFIYFALEVLWVHLLAAVIGNSVYAFATMLTAVLLSLAIGSALSAVVTAEGSRVSWRFIGALMLGGGIALVVTHGLWPAIPHSLVLSGSRLRSFGPAEFLRFRHALLVIALPATILGMLFPNLFRLRTFPTSRLGDFVGKTAAANAVGCAAGALVTSFVLLPKFGSQRLLVWFAIALVVSGAGIACWRARGAALVAAAVAVVILLGVSLPRWDLLKLTSGEHVYFQPVHVQSGDRLLFFHEDTAGGITTVVERDTREGKERTLLTNGKFQGNNTGEVSAQVGFVILPSMMTRKFDDALVIGAGTACSASVVHDVGFQRIRIAEIAPGMLIAAANFFRDINHNVLFAPNVHIDVEDGRNDLLLHDRTYDMITMEISSIWFANATNLYSVEFYRLAHSRLNPGGVLQQWIQLHHMETYDVLSVVGTMRKVFPYVSVWVVGSQAVLIGSDEPQIFHREGVAHSGILARTYGAGHPLPQFVFGDLGARQILSPAAVTRAVETLQPIINTDRNRFLEYSTPKGNLRADWTVERMLSILGNYSDHSLPPIEAGAAGGR